MSVFSKIIAREIPAQIIYETSSIIVIKDIKPCAPIHYLIIPKLEIVDMADPRLDKELCWELVSTVQYLAQQLPDDKSFNLISNNGASAGQTVFHLHWHFIAGVNPYSKGIISF